LLVERGKRGLLTRLHIDMLGVAFADFKLFHREKANTLYRSSLGATSLCTPFYLNGSTFF